MEKKEEMAKLADEQIGKVSGGATSIFGSVIPDGLVCPNCREYKYLVSRDDGTFVCCQCDIRIDGNGTRIDGDAKQY